jgi:hypothetical protein
LYAKLVKPKSNAIFATIEADDCYTISLPLHELMGRRLKPYMADRCCLSFRKIKEQELGFWEQREYSNSADQWKEERYSY